MRRCGELLKQFDGRGRPAENRDGTAPNYSQRQVGHDAGMSERQIKTAVRVANVPDERFETVVESEQPPTVTKLAEMGRQSRALAKTRDGPSRVCRLPARGTLLALLSALSEGE